MKKANSTPSDFHLDSAYHDYLDDIKYLEGYLKREFPRFYLRIREEVNEFWSDLISSIPELKKSKKIKKDILELVTSTLNHQLLYDQELEIDARENEKRKSKTKTRVYLNSYLDNTIDGILGLPKFIVTTFSESIKKEPGYVKELEMKLANALAKIKKDKPYVNRGIQMAGKKIQPEKLALYRLIHKIRKELIEKYSSGHQISIKKAAKSALKKTVLKHPSAQLILDTSKAYSKYLREHPESFL